MAGRHTGVAGAGVGVPSPGQTGASRAVACSATARRRFGGTLVLNGEPGRWSTGLRLGAGKAF